MVSHRKARARRRRWERYMRLISRSSVRHHDYPFGLSVKTTPGYFAPRRVMHHRGVHWRAFQALVASDEIFRSWED